MSKISILPADTYVVMNKSIINENDHKILTMLYQPIIGYLPVSLYLSLWSDLDKMNIMSIEYTHHHLMTSMKLNLNDIIDAREKLEAIGLIKTHLKKSNINNYVYQLYAPLSASEFLTHPLLNVLLYSHIGQKEYDKIINYYKLPKIDLSSFEDITVHFSDIFDTSSNNSIELSNVELKGKHKSNIKIDNIIDFDFIISSIPKEIINDKTFDKSTKDLINNLSFLYKIDNLHMINIIRNCINERNSIDKLKLKNACRNYYQFENDNKLPNLIYRTQPEHLQSNIKDNTNRSKIIYTFETLSPYDFLRAKYHGGVPTSRDVRLIESLMIDQSLNPGVVNVLIDYILKINNNKLNKSYVETIAGQWKRLNIKTVEEAMSQAEKEHKKYKKSTKESPRKGSTEKLPDWFNKDIKEEKLSEDEEEKIKDMLKEFQ